eukprot:scaffold41277_cov35-Phaeocystis_antarctica.AAC.1
MQRIFRAAVFHFGSSVRLVLLFSTLKQPRRKKTCRSARVWCFWRIHTTDPKDETTDTAGSQGVRVYQKA